MSKYKSEWNKVNYGDLDLANINLDLKEVKVDDTKVIATGEEKKQVNGGGDGYVEDLVRCAKELVCLEGHFADILQNIFSDAELGTENELNASDIHNLLDDTCNLRRQAMRQIASKLGIKSDKMWCVIKHSMKAENTAYEAYMGSDSDSDLLDIWIQARKIFVKSFMLWANKDLTGCSACLNDMLKRVE